MSRALAAIEQVVPWAHADLLRALGSRSGLVVVDGEAALIRRSAGDAVGVSATFADADVVCTTTTACILSLLHGHDDLLEALETDRVSVKGAIDAVLAFNDVLRAFLHGAVRARVFEDLRASFEARATNLGSRNVS